MAERIHKVFRNRGSCHDHSVFAQIAVFDCGLGAASRNVFDILRLIDDHCRVAARCFQKPHDLLLCRNRDQRINIDCENFEAVEFHHQLEFRLSLFRFAPNPSLPRHSLRHVPRDLFCHPLRVNAVFGDQQHIIRLSFAPSLAHHGNSRPTFACSDVHEQTEAGFVDHFLQGAFLVVSGRGFVNEGRSPLVERTVRLCDPCRGFHEGSGFNLRVRKRLCPNLKVVRRVFKRELFAVHPTFHPLQLRQCTDHPHIVNRNCLHPIAFDFDIHFRSPSVLQFPFPFLSLFHPFPSFYLSLLIQSQQRKQRIKRKR